MLVPLAARQNQDVFVTVVMVEWDPPGFAKSQQSGGWSNKAVSIEAMDFHSLAEGLPWQAIRVFCDAEDVRDFDDGRCGRIWIHRVQRVGECAPVGRGNWLDAPWVRN